MSADKSPLEIRLDEIEAKLDQLIAVTERAEALVNGFMTGKNAKYLALLAKVGGKL